MNAVRGRVHGGHFEPDAAPAEGAEAVVLARGGDDAFDLEEARPTEFDARITRLTEGSLNR